MSGPISVDQTVEVIEIVELNETIEIQGGSRDALSIQGRAVATDAPSDDDVYAWDAAEEEWTPKAIDELAGGFVNITGDTMTGPLVVDGGVDEIQLRVQGHSTQTANIVVIEQSDGTDIVAVAVAGVTVTGIASVSGALTASGGVDGVIGGVTPAASDFTTVDASGLVTANANVQLAGSFLYGDTASGGDLGLFSTTHGTTGMIYMGSITNGFIFDEANNRVSIGTADTEYTIGGVTKSSVLVTETGGGMNAYDLIFHRHSNNSPTFLGLMRSRGSHNSPDILEDGDTIAKIEAFGFDDTDWEESSGIHFEIDGTPADGIMPGLIRFETTDDAGAPQTALTLNADQTGAFAGAVTVALTLGVTGALTASGGMDGVVGGVTPAAGTFTTLNATGGGSLTGTWDDLGSVTTIDINGGTVGGVTLDGTISGTPTWASTQGMNISGNAATATALETARTIGNVSFDGSANIVPETMAVVDSTDATSSIAMFDSATGSLQAKTDAGLTYDATTGILTATGFAGPLTGAVTGNADTATLAATVTVVDSTDATSFVALFDSATGSLQAKTDAGLTYDSTTGILTATGFAGPLTGAVTGNADTATALETARTIGGVSFDGTANIVPQTIQVVDGTDATSFVGIFDSATGDLQPKTDAGLTYDATTGTLTATALAGPLTGNASTATALETARNINGVAFDGTGDITVTAAAGTLTGATLNATVTASSLTSLGTIISLVATTADINGGTFDGIVGGTTPAAGDFTNLGASGTLDVSGITGLGGTNATTAELLVVQGAGTVPTLNGSTGAVFQNNATAGNESHITLLSGASGTGQINFGDADDENRGAIFYNQSTDVLSFRVLTGTRLTLDGSGDMALTGDLTVSGTGPHAIGGAVSTQHQILLTGAFTPSSWGSVVHIESTITGAVDEDIFGLLVRPAMTEAASGTHGVAALLQVDAGIMVGAGATTTTAASVRIVNAPSIGATNYALWVDAGATQLDGTLAVTGTATFSSLTTNFGDQTDASCGLFVDQDRSGAGSALGQWEASWDGTPVADILLVTGSDTSNKDEGRILFRTAAAGGSMTTALTIDETQLATFAGGLALTGTTRIDLSGTTVDTTAGTGISGSSSNLRLTSGTSNINFQSNGGVTELGRWLTTGALMIGDSANANMTIGVTINQGAADDEALALKSSDVAHPMTTLTETDAYGTFKKHASAGGGLQIAGYTDSGGAAGNAIQLIGNLGEAADTTKSTAGIGIITMNSRITDGGTSVGAAGADSNLFVIQSHGTTRYIFDLEGSAHADVEWTTFSDSRLKQNVEVIPYGLEAVRALGAKVFDKHSGYVGSNGEAVLEERSRRMLGFLAQEVRDVMPELVKDVDTSESFYSLDYGRFTPVLWSAVGEMDAIQRNSVQRIETTERDVIDIQEWRSETEVELESARSRITELEGKVEKLEKKAA